MNLPKKDTDVEKIFEKHNVLMNHKFRSENFNSRMFYVLFCSHKDFSSDNYPKEFEKSDLAPHFFIDRKGNIYQLIDIEKRSFYMAENKTHFSNRDHIEDTAISVEIQNNGTGFTTEQKSASVSLFRYLADLCKLNFTSAVSSLDVRCELNCDDLMEDYDWHFFYSNFTEYDALYKLNDENALPLVSEQSSKGDIEKIRQKLKKLNYWCIEDEEYKTLSEVFYKFNSKYVKDAKIFSNSSKPLSPAEKRGLLSKWYQVSDDRLTELINLNPNLQNTISGHFTVSINSSFNARAFSERIMHIILHYTESLKLENTIEAFKSRGVSSHFIIDRDGTVYSVVDLDKRAYHAGISFWEGRSNLNDTSIGIEIENNGNEAFTDEQYGSIINVCKALCEIYQIDRKKIISHADIAPPRKLDTGSWFSWFRLYKELDLYSDFFKTKLSEEEQSMILCDRDGNAVDDFDIKQMQEDLFYVGYDIKITGKYDQQTRDVVYSFNLRLADFYNKIFGREIEKVVIDDSGIKRREILRTEKNQKWYKISREGLSYLKKESGNIINNALISTEKKLESTKNMS